jgi:hypothetical protein
MGISTHLDDVERKMIALACKKMPISVLLLQ